jgi:cobalt-zinc-cadmium efflux system membrane fusion protein
MATIESTELGQAQSAFLEAQARYGPAKATLDRLRRLFQEDLVARKELLAAENQVRLAEIDLEKTRNQLALLGYGPDRINSLVRSRQIDATIPVTAPISGIIIAKHVTLGEQISPGDVEPAFTISDVSDLWVNANLYEKDLAKVHEGQKAVVTTPAFLGRTYQGRVSLISTTLDEVTRTAKARIVVANSDRRLKPEMFATIRIKVGQQQALAIPESALVTDKDETFVFVQRAPETFEKRPIQVGEKAGGLYPVTAGLKAGEPVVTAGGFTLKSELLKESFGEHDH